MGFVEGILGAKRPASVRSIALPRRQAYYPSPADWRDEIIYFLLPDRFSDGNEATRPLLVPAARTRFRPVTFKWNDWSTSGAARYQGGTIAGITTKLPYLRDLGVNTIWVGPVFKQRLHLDTYHGYAVQDFLEVDPRLGTRKDLVALVEAAHQKQLRIILDVVINHSGDNWIYQVVPPTDTDQPPYLPWPQFYPRGSWRDGSGGLVPTIGGDDDGVWPSEVQPAPYYTRAGEGNLGAGDLDDPHAEFRRSDFDGDRDINYDGTDALDDVARCYKYWIALTDCDGLRIDTLKHVDAETGRNFCGTIKEFAANLGKADFFLVGEVAGSDSDATRYRQVLGSNLNATLDIGESRLLLHAAAKGLAAPSGYLDFLDLWEDMLGSHRGSGARHVTILDDHDHVSGDKERFSADAIPADRQVVAGVALQLFGLGIPCVYYGTEQAFAGPEASERKWLADYPYPNVQNATDKYLREAMFGPEHPRLSGRAGLPAGAPGQDPALPGFGPFGTCGAHAFDPNSAAYVRIAHLTAVRGQYPVLRYGRQYQRAVSHGGGFAPPQAGELIVWSRILDDEEALCVVNGNGIASSSADVIVDSSLNAPIVPGWTWPPPGGPSLLVVANTAHASATVAGTAYAGAHPIGQRLPVKTMNGNAYVEIRNLDPAEVLVLSNR